MTALDQEIESITEVEERILEDVVDQEVEIMVDKIDLIDKIIGVIVEIHVIDHDLENIIIEEDDFKLDLEL